MEPTDYDGFLRRGCAFHSKGKQGKAETDFRAAITYSSDSIDAKYGLGLVMKAQGKKEESVELFQQWMQLIDQGKIKEHS